MSPECQSQRVSMNKFSRQSVQSLVREGHVEAAVGKGPRSSSRPKSLLRPRRRPGKAGVRVSLPLDHDLTRLFNNEIESVLHLTEKQV